MLNLFYLIIYHFYLNFSCMLNRLNSIVCLQLDGSSQKEMAAVVCVTEALVRQSAKKILTMTLKQQGDNDIFLQ